MNKAQLKLLILMTVCLCISAFAVNSKAEILSESQKVSIDGKWDFTFTRSSSSEIPEIPSDESFDVKLEIPGFWNNQKEAIKSTDWYQNITFVDGNPRLIGINWCKKQVAVPENWQGRIVNLNINRAIGHVNIWVNRKWVAKYNYGFYTPFIVDVSEHLEYGSDNEILISVDNAKIGGFSGAWCFFAPYYIASGISDSVFLDVSAGKGSIDDIYIRPGETLNDFVCQVKLDSAQAPQIKDSVLSWEIWDQTQQNLIAQGQQAVQAFNDSTQIDWQKNIDSLKPWSVHSPNLYWCKLKWLSSDKEILDDAQQRFGLRRLSYKGRKLFLNDKPIYLRGEFGGYYHPTHGGIPTSKEYWLWHLKIAKEMGMNYLNFAAQVCPIGLLEAADELGIILQCGDHITVLKEYRELYKDVWPNIIRLTRKYPSLCIYGFGGERNYYEGIIEQYQKQRELIKSMHPAVFIMPQQAIRGVDYAFFGSPGVVQEPFPHHPERLARYTKTCDMFGHYSCTAFSYSFDEPPLWHEMDKRFEIYDRPLSAHELFIAGSYLNPDNMSKYTDCFPPVLYKNTEKKLKEAGVFEKWPTYSKNSELLQGICIKYNLEKVRKCDNMVAFEFLGMQDLHIFPPKTFAVGILDEFLQYKKGVSPEYIKQSNDDTVLLLDYDGGHSINRAYWANDTFQADIMLSHYGEQDIKNAQLSWELKDADAVILSDNTQLSDFAAGFSKKIHELQLTWPDVKKTTMLNLTVTLEFADKTLSNNWNFWAFPRPQRKEVVADFDQGASDLIASRFNVKQVDSKTQIVTSLDEDQLTHLENGGDVLLLGADSFPVYNKYTKFRPGLGARTHQNVGKVIYDHPVFENLLNDGWGNWHFYYIFNEASNILFDDIVKDYGVTFDPIIEVISPAEEVRKQAMMFEYNVGKGRLFVAANVFNMGNAACVTLLDSVISYVQSDKFNPQNALALDTLKKIVSPEPVKSEEVSKDSQESQQTLDYSKYEWQNEPAKIIMKPDDLCRVNNGRWQGIWVVKITEEGLSKVEIKRAGTDSVRETKMVCLDFTPPALKLNSSPAIDQEGGIYIAVADAKYTLTAQDNLSGVKQIEYSTDDGETYHVYFEPFKLNKGYYKLRFKVSDNAGNETDFIFSEELTGGKTNQVVLKVD